MFLKLDPLSNFQFKDPVTLKPFCLCKQTKLQVVYFGVDSLNGGKLLNYDNFSKFIRLLCCKNIALDYFLGMYQLYRKDPTAHCEIKTFNHSKLVNSANFIMMYVPDDEIEAAKRVEQWLIPTYKSVIGFHYGGQFSNDSLSVFVNTPTKFGVYYVLGEWANLLLVNNETNEMFKIQDAFVKGIYDLKEDKFCVRPFIRVLK